MAATPLTVVATDAWERALFDSESRYFEAAADNAPLLGGTFSVMPGFARLPAGCVLHGLGADAFTACGIGHLAAVEARFRQAGSRLCRLYLPAGTGHLNRALLSAGYRPVRELGMIAELSGDVDGGGDGETDDPGLVAVSSARDWREKGEICRAAIDGPDGHDMQDGRYAELEQAKCRAGYMRSYLYRLDGHPVATAALALHEGFARLKNVLVHPAHRSLGAGRNLVRALTAEARRLGARRLGCFVSSRQALSVYRQCGMWDMCFHTEWSRVL
jgi:ribosomal protein S18 acetylase RimI-like enzyme